jgi:hypothetical protein
MPPTKADYDRIEELGAEMARLMLKFKRDDGHDGGPYGVVGQAVWRLGDAIDYWKERMPRPDA